MKEDELETKKERDRRKLLAIIAMKKLMHEEKEQSNDYLRENKTALAEDKGGNKRSDES